MSLEEQKARIADKCDILHALLALTRSVTHRELDILKRTRSLLENGSRDRLDHAEFILEVNLQTAEQYAGFKGPQRFLLDFGKLYREQQFELMNFPKMFIDSELFEHYEKVIPHWGKLQPHALAHVDFRGEDHDVYLPEASLYEDMCFAYNQAVATAEGSTKLERKAHVFYVRTSIISAYNFVESYLNGLAFDFIVSTKKKLSQSEQDFLSEWDSARNRQRFVSFRDKAIQYPRVILNAEIPPFTESSCPAFAVLMSRLHSRDAIVHNSPKLSSNGEEMPKIRNLVELRFSDSTLVVDAAINFVKLIDKSVNGSTYDNSWLIPRSVEGPFPPEAFN